MRVLSNGKRITYKTWLFARQSLNIVNCGFCSNRIPLYFPLCVCLCTGVTSQLFSIIWCRAWKPYIFWKHIIQADHPDHSYHLTIWPPDHLTIWPPDHLTTWTTQAIMNTLTALTTWPPDHLTTRPLNHPDQWPPWPPWPPWPCQLQIYSVYAYCISFKYCHQILWCKMLLHM